jgi:hypothetical protein
MWIFVCVMQTMMICVMIVGWLVNVGWPSIGVHVAPVLGFDLGTFPRIESAWNEGIAALSGVGAQG